MRPIELICADMDGTLLNPDREISAATADALRQAEERGIHVALCSGRAAIDLGSYARQSGLNAHLIGLNGGVVSPLGGRQSAVCFPPDIARRLMTLFAESGLVWGCFGEKLLCVSHSPGGFEPGYWGTWLEGDGSRVMYDGLGTEALLAEGLCKAVAVDTGDGSRLRTLLRRMEAKLPPLEQAASWETNIEVNPAGVNKGAAVLRLAETLNVPLSRVMCVGDNDNDVSMLRLAGVAVAMDNGTRAAKAAAGWLCPDNAHDGAAAAIRRLALGEPQPGVRRN